MSQMALAFLPSFPRGLLHLVCGKGRLGENCQQGNGREREPRRHSWAPLRQQGGGRGAGMGCGHCGKWSNHQVLPAGAAADGEVASQLRGQGRGSLGTPRPHPPRKEGVGAADLLLGKSSWSWAGKQEGRLERGGKHSLAGFVTI